MNTVTSHDGTSIAVDRSGQGPAVILVGGAFNTRSSAAPLAELLAPRFTVFTYDRRGRGDSGDTAPYAVAREIEDLDAVIQLAGGSALVYGHSSGAALALDAAAAGSSISRLALYEPPFVVTDGPREGSTEYTTRLGELVSAGHRAEAVALFLSSTGLSAEAITRMRATPVWTDLEELAHTLLYDNAVMGDGSLPTDRAAAVAVSTLVLAGGASPAWARESAQALAEAVPSARQRTLENQTHDAEPAALATVLTEFFAG
ncbi:alpha/beta fold hydrolase [Actinoalloteichus hymeniacidonis]|jgi:pimeloyl-ACP methyl ester carboxylesterase|uniref:Lysophospholipase n=1 Tax=Actinoalloteichus hymeniacidonis TaxID=340345 RepID=A0AAC9HR21_9PSEU|nr:alpha/beta hydrolase [Actinoalloteichus hymeniacidonis]AOS63865.1 lysophospholipase [Actinoalloteichus hymeniacidonis]MBB5908079.1 pimeloyl-ACP methyl ester carboxylesterase [Actinoalloteichus hymeniacidonis]